MNTAQKDTRRRGLRAAAAAAMLMPAIVVAAAQVLMKPDPELWLSNHYRGIARPDAFDSLTRIAPIFCVSTGVLFGLAAALVLIRRTPYLIPLFSGPVLTVVACIAVEDLSDPAWFTVLAVFSIGVFAGSVITMAWLAIRTWSRNADADICDRPGFEGDQLIT